MTVERLLPNAEAEDLLAMTRQIADAELSPIASEYEMQERYPEHAFQALGEAGPQEASVAKLIATDTASSASLIAIGCNAQPETASISAE